MHLSAIYLASPFSSDDKLEKEWRFLKACDAAGYLMQQGKIVFSPIAHGWPIAKIRDLSTDWDYWYDQCGAMISRCQTIIVLCLPGWDKSTGVYEELKIAKAWNLELLYMDPDTYKLSTTPPK